MAFILNPYRFAAAASLSDAILALNPLGYWKLDETTGTTITDYGSVGANGTISGGYALATAAGPDGKSYAKFKEGGTPARVAINDDSAWSVTSSGLIVFAMVRPDASGGGDIITKGGASSYEWRMGGAAGSNLDCSLWGRLGANRQTESATTATLPNGTGWAAVAVEFFNTTLDGRPDLFMDSATPLATTQGSNTDTFGYLNGTNQVNIGWRADGGGTSYDGALAHVAIFPGGTDLSTVFTAAANEGWI